MPQKTITLPDDLYNELKKKYGKEFLKEIGDIDQLISSIILQRKEQLITHNVKYYDKIRGLNIFNWDN